MKLELKMSYHMFQKWMKNPCCPIPWSDMYAISRARRKAQDKKRRHERCSNCVFVCSKPECSMKGWSKWHCPGQLIDVKPYWHMACFKEREE